MSRNETDTAQSGGVVASHEDGGVSSVGRRAFFSGAAALGSLSLFSSAQAAGSSPSVVQAPGTTGLLDPVTRYPAPPFPQQPQKWPGLQSEMTPRPDCGEEHYQGSGRLAGRKALITGGDSGIGRAVAIAYAREGADVAISYLPQEESDAREVAALIQKAGRKAVLLPGDIRKESICQKIVHKAVLELDGLDILVNNAGRQRYCEDILELTTEEFDWTLKTNIYALFWLVKAAVPHMPKGSAIINTASRNAYQPNPILVDYAMTKAGIANMTHSLARQFLPRGIRVNAVAPGPFWTPLQVCGAQPQSVVQHFGDETPYHRPGQPVEIAPVYVTLASQESSYVTGQVWGITGGDGVPG
ncbi:SDR family oxidoreductase [Bombella sp. TMW 2.2543]|uniref:SDR family oxidoreductase n=1 Tax=Bombella pluederhausensis TaxID=2967336 RepID=A0ABT3WF40_9PROT|nr:SDR family oxidoreductase [Bombella pluederhausensis]MCX5617298.1 SDR family oxidoreductase [Bombella pluederhausensis]